MISREKQILRTSLIATLAALPDKDASSVALRRHLQHHPAWISAQTIYGFYPLSSEPDWLGRDDTGDKRLAFPRTDSGTLTFFSGGKMVVGPHGAGEPQGGGPAAPPDLVLVPGLAFDATGYRLGRGGGFYDRWLGAHPRVITLGLCFSAQIVETLPLETHDLRVDAVLTESGIIGSGS